MRIGISRVTLTRRPHKGGVVLAAFLVAAALLPSRAADGAVRIILARHGESAFDPSTPQTTATPDPDLSEKGCDEARRLANLAVEERVTEIYSSPLTRARHTAEIVAARLGLEVRVVPEFAEFNLGDLLGRDWRVSPYREQLAEVFANVDRARPGGETFRQLHERATKAFSRILGPTRQEQATILVVAHGVTNRALVGLARAMSIEEAFALESQPGDRAWFFHTTPRGYSAPASRSY